MSEWYGVDYHSIKRALNHKTWDITERYIQTRVGKICHVFDAVDQEIVWPASDEHSPNMKTDEPRAVDLLVDEALGDIGDTDEKERGSDLET